MGLAQPTGCDVPVLPRLAGQVPGHGIVGTLDDDGREYLARRPGILDAQVGAGDDIQSLVGCRGVFQHLRSGLGLQCIESVRFMVARTFAIGTLLPSELFWDHRPAAADWT